MRIACLVTVYAVISLTLHVGETVHLARQKYLEGKKVELSSKNATVSTKTTRTVLRPEIPSPQMVQSGAYIQSNKKSRRTIRRVRRNHAVVSHQYDLNRLKRERFRRQHRRLKTRSLRLGRSYDVMENQIETIQSPTVFDDGAIHIEPLYRVTKKKNILDSIVELLQRVIDPPASHLGPLVGPLHFPGMGDKVYVRLLDPLHSNHVVIRLITQMPVSEIESAFHENIFPNIGEKEVFETPAIDYESSFVPSEPILSESKQHQEATQTSSDVVNKISDASSSATYQIENVLSKSPTKQIGHTSRVFTLNSKHSDPQRSPIIIQTVTKPRQQYLDDSRYLRDQSLYNRNRQRTTFSKDDYNSKITKLKEVKETNENDKLNRSKFTNTPFYPYHPSYYQSREKLKPVDSISEGTSKIEDKRTKESLNPLYVNVDNSPVQVTRASRVVSLHSLPAAYPMNDESFQIVKAPTLQSIQVTPPLSKDYISYKNYTTIAPEDFTLPTKKISYVHSNVSVDLSKLNKKDVAGQKRTNNTFSKLVKYGVVKALIYSNHSWEPTKTRSPIKHSHELLQSQNNQNQTYIKPTTIKPTITKLIKVLRSVKPVHIGHRNLTTLNVTNTVKNNTKARNKGYNICATCQNSKKNLTTTTEEYDYEEIFFDDYYGDQPSSGNSTTSMKSPFFPVTTLRPAFNNTMKIMTLNAVNSTKHSTIATQELNDTRTD